MIQFSDGKLYWGGFDLYRTGEFEVSHKAFTQRDILRTNFENIRPINCGFIYTKSAIIKFTDVTKEDFEAYERDGRIDAILKSSF